MIGRPNTALAHIHMQIMWSRLIAVVEEQAQTLVRTAFSTSVREAGDLSAGVFDRDGNMLAQAVTGTPGHVNSMAAAVKHFLDAFPLATMKEGDHYITNDPWLTCGHLHDLTVVSPTFLRAPSAQDGPVGLFASTVHVVDIGGLGMGPDGRQVFEEGLTSPLLPLSREGLMNEDLLGILRANVREPLQVEGDVYALAACNDEGSRRLVEMMEEFGLANLDRLGEHIIETSRAATIEAIGTLRPGKYKNSVSMDGYDRPLTLAGEMTIGPDAIHDDYTGTSPASAFGINVVMNYTLAYTAFGVKCLVAPEVPNNAGSLAPITATAPEGCLLNVKRPRAVAACHTVGHMLPDTCSAACTRSWRAACRRKAPRHCGTRRSMAAPMCSTNSARASMTISRRSARSSSIAAAPARGREGRARRHRLSVGRAHDPGRGDRVDRAGHVPPPRIPRRLGRRGTLSRRARTGHRVGRGGRHAGRPAVQFRADQQPGTRPRRRRQGGGRPGRIGFRQADPLG